MGFTKLDDNLDGSSIFREPDAVFKVWMLILSKTRSDGLAPISADYIVSITRKSDDEVDRCLEILKGPDPHSRSQNDEGRRIRRVDGGFHVINYEKYRQKAGADGVREYERERKKAYRKDGSSREGGSRDGYVYFLRSGAAVKIGFSSNPWARAKELHAGMAEKGELIATVAGYFADESAIHQRFAHLRLNSEWFKYDGEIESYVAALRSSSPGLSASASSSGIEGGVGETAQTTEAVRLVFSHWQAVMGKPKAKLTGDRERRIKARIREGYTVDDLKAAVDGCKASAWHQGANADAKVFDDLELICRDGKHVEQFMGSKPEPEPVKPDPKVAPWERY